MMSTTDKNKFKRFEFLMDKKSDAKIIEWLDKQPNKGLYIRTLIQKDLRRASRR